MTQNCSPSDGPGGRLARRDVHYNNPRANFPLPLLDKARIIEWIGNVGVVTHQEVVLEEGCLKKAPLTSSMDLTNQIEIGQSALR